MTKSTTTPSQLLIKKWAYNKTNHKTTPDWVTSITTVEHADLLLSLVLDQNCPKRAVILKSLYFLVGTSVSKHNVEDIAKIQELLDKAKLSSDQVIINWVNRSRIVLKDLKKFDYIEWCQGGFSEKDLPTIN